MRTIPVVARVAAIILLVLSSLVILVGIATGQPLFYPVALIYLLAGIGILQRKIWSAFGLALLLAGQLIVAVFLRFTGNHDRTAANLFSALALSLIICPLCFFAGRNLAKSGGQLGRPFAWIALTALATLPWFFVRAYVMPSASMEDTLLVGDRLLVRVFPKPAVAFGDVIAFQFPSDHAQTLTKRVIGLPGDHIRIAHKLVFRNGVILSEPYAVSKFGFEDPYKDNFPNANSAESKRVTSDYPGLAALLDHHVVSGEVVVPQGCYFVLGDNRDNSLDSRFWGFVSSHEVIGKPFLIYDSIETKQEELTSPSKRGQTRWARIFKRI